LRFGFQRRVGYDLGRMTFSSRTIGGTQSLPYIAYRR
jgi:hypothetical protein